MFNQVRIYLTPSLCAGCDSWSIFKQSTFGLNSKLRKMILRAITVKFSKQSNFQFSLKLYHRQDLTEGQFLSKIKLL